ncbi:MAG: SRPBCC family protein [Myxococcota bacterium]|nr:SRPBCC family protein [Myxococcota bacterium]
MPPLDSQNFSVDEDIRRALSLPPEAFTEQEVLDRELETIFSSSWLLAPEPEAGTPGEKAQSLCHEVIAPLSYAPFELCGHPLYVHRGTDDALRCFPNVCTHAWYPLVTDQGTGKALTCGQHGRRFDCTGQFLSQPSFTDMPDFPRNCDHLAEVPFREWNGLGFASLGTPRFSFDHVFQPINASLGRLPLDTLERVMQTEEVRIVDGNWKQHAWNFMDKFHIPFIHRGPNGLVDILDYRSYQTELYDHAALQWAWAKHPEHGFEPDHLPERFRDTTGKGRRVIALWWFVFPNLTLNFYPWGLSINRYDPIKSDPTKTRFYWHHYVMDQAKYLACESIWQNSKVDDEDVVAMGLVQRGIESGFAARGRFAPSEEAGPHWFHRTVSEHLQGSAEP